MSEKTALNRAFAPGRRAFARALLAAVAAVSVTAAPWALAADEAPDEMIRQLSDEVLELIRSDDKLQQGDDLDYIMKIVDEKIMPNVNFRRMTASATGPAWRRATPEQREKLQESFKGMLVRTYAGALRLVDNQTIEMLPMRSRAEDEEVVVRTRVRGNGNPIQLDYRMEKTPGEGHGWKIYDLNVAGVWLVSNYRPQFSQEINRGGIDGLIQSLSERSGGSKS